MTVLYFPLIRILLPTAHYHLSVCVKKVSVSVALREDRNSANLCLTPFRVCETDCSEERNSGKKIVENPQEGKTHVKNG